MLIQFGQRTGTFNKTTVINLNVSFSNTDYIILGEGIKSNASANWGCIEKTVSSVKGEMSRGDSGNYSATQFHFIAIGF